MREVLGRLWGRAIGLVVCLSSDEGEIRRVAGSIEESRSSSQEQETRNIKENAEVVSRRCFEVTSKEIKGKCSPKSNAAVFSDLDSWLDSKMGLVEKFRGDF